MWRSKNRLRFLLCLNSTFCHLWMTYTRFITCDYLFGYIHLTESPCVQITQTFVGFFSIFLYDRQSKLVTNIPHLLVRRPMPQTARPYSMRLTRETASKNLYCCSEFIFQHCIIKSLQTMMIPWRGNSFRVIHVTGPWWGEHRWLIPSQRPVTQGLLGFFNVTLYWVTLRCWWFVMLWRSCNVTVTDSMLHLNKVQLHHIAFIWFISISTRVYCLYNK